jgi:hypothetical protein
MAFIRKDIKPGTFMTLDCRERAVVKGHDSDDPAARQRELIELATRKLAELRKAMVVARP